MAIITEPASPRTRGAMLTTLGRTPTEISEIVAIPTVVRRSPSPMRKTIGDLSHEDRVRVGLHLRASR